MNLYEIIFIGRQDLSQQQIEALGVNLGLFVSQNGGEVSRSEYCGFRTLAYPIKKNHKGHYYIMQIKASPEVVAELDRTMKINEDIIRFMIVKVNKFDEKDNLITQVKAFVDEFGMVKDKGYRSASYNNNNNKDSAENIDQAEKTAVVE
ncbi:MAG: 30S ribosomal protein S6 [Alphaproteobacteria bacterium]|nr:30S ribosomal protein S6 [Alphaproteobacteria bacterium]